MPRRGRIAAVASAIAAEARRELRRRGEEEEEDGAPAPRRTIARGRQQQKSLFRNLWRKTEVQFSNWFRIL